MNAVGESEHTQSLMQFLSSFDLSTESQVSQLLHYHNPNCRTPAQSFESLYIFARTQSCKMMTMKKKKKKMLQQTDRLQPYPSLFRSHLKNIWMLSVNPNTHRVSCNSSLPLISAQNLKYHNFSIITTLIAELLHSLLSLCIFLRGHNPARWWRWRRRKTLQNSSPTATINQENKTHCRILPPPRQSTKKTKPIKKKNKTKQNKKTKVRAVPGNCLDIIIGPSGLQLPST